MARAYALAASAMRPRSWPLARRSLAETGPFRSRSYYVTEAIFLPYPVSLWPHPSFRSLPTGPSHSTCALLPRTNFLYRTFHYHHCHFPSALSKSTLARTSLFGWMISIACTSKLRSRISVSDHFILKPSITKVSLMFKCKSQFSWINAFWT